MENICLRALGLIIVAKSQMSTAGNEFKTNVKIFLRKCCKFKGTVENVANLKGLLKNVANLKGL